MANLDLRELEAFLVLAEELHFGRAGERLYVSQSRVSQLLRSLETRIGGRLLERTSRRVRLTPLGDHFLAALRPSYDGLRTALDDARSEARGVRGRLRLGFHGTADDDLMRAITLFQDRYPDCAIELVEIPLGDPFGALRAGRADLAVVLAPVEEDDLAAGPVFARHPLTLAVAAGHPFAGRPVISAEDLADCALIGISGPAPASWLRALTPTTTPGGRPIPAGPSATTLQEALTLAATGRGAFLLCRATAGHHHRPALAHIPVTGLPDSALTLIWPRTRETPRTRAFATTLTTTLTSRPEHLEDLAPADPARDRR